MSTNESEAFTPVDRTGWSRGPWDNEPDRVEWRSAAGTPCLAVRVSSGAWCGYAAIAATHPWATLDLQCGSESPDIDCHGGITYGPTPCQVGGKVCHVPLAGEPDDVRWIGFDCSHSWDEYPTRTWSSGDGSYRDLGYVRAEVEKLAAQAEAAS